MEPKLTCSLSSSELSSPVPGGDTSYFFANWTNPLVALLPPMTHTSFCTPLFPHGVYKSSQCFITNIWTSSSLPLFCDRWNLLMTAKGLTQG